MQGRKWGRVAQTEQIQGRLCPPPSSFPQFQDPTASMRIVSQKAIYFPAGRRFPCLAATSPPAVPLPDSPPLRYPGNHRQWQIICLCGVNAKRSLPCRGTEQDSGTFPLSKHSKWVLQSCEWQFGESIQRWKIHQVKWLCEKIRFLASFEVPG